jgi:hypothetical protein
MQANTTPPTPPDTTCGHIFDRDMSKRSWLSHALSGARALHGPVTDEFLQYSLNRSLVDADIEAACWDSVALNEHSHYQHHKIGTFEEIG